jgi:excisionase family DNA binding protein
MEEPDDNKNNKKRINNHAIDELIKSVIASMPIVGNDEPMTVEQATHFLGYRDVHVVLELIHSKKLKAHRVGPMRWLIWKSDLITYINEH